MLNENRICTARMFDIIIFLKLICLDIQEDCNDNGKDEE